MCACSCFLWFINSLRIKHQSNSSNQKCQAEGIEFLRVLTAADHLDQVSLALKAAQLVNTGQLFDICGLPLKKLFKFLNNHHSAAGHYNWRCQFYSLPFPGNVHKNNKNIQHSLQNNDSQQVQNLHLNSD